MSLYGVYDIDDCGMKIFAVGVSLQCQFLRAVPQAACCDFCELCHYLCASRYLQFALTSTCRLLRHDQCCCTVK